MLVMFKSLSFCKFKYFFKAKSKILSLVNSNYFSFCRNISSKRLVLGIETSCDDTGAAIVDENGTILGEGYKSQLKIHLENGGVIPHFAAHFHKENIQGVVETTLAKSNIQLCDVSAIAVSTKPGLRGSLAVGIQHAMSLARTSQRPLIPIHHMEAHALTARLSNDIPFPFLCLLASGGHCQIIFIKGITEFFLLGDSQHNSPGEVLDKIARRLKLQNLPQCSEMSGGEAIDHMANGGDPLYYSFPHIMTHIRDCNFSFSGFASFSRRIIEREEIKHDVPPDGVIPTVQDFCASLLCGYSLHLMHRLHRAFIFCEQTGLIDSGSKRIVFSGGVACNQFIQGALKNMCKVLKADFYVPASSLCTDNGVMIAWNGMEKLRSNIDIFPPHTTLQPESNASLGIDIRNSVLKASIKVKLPKKDFV